MKFVQVDLDMFEVVKLVVHVPQFVALVPYSNDGQPSGGTVSQLKISSSGPMLITSILLGGENMSV